MINSKAPFEELYKGLFKGNCNYKGSIQGLHHQNKVSVDIVLYA